MIAIPNIEKPKKCRTCNFKSNKEGECWFVHDENDCQLIDIVQCKECKWAKKEGDESKGHLTCACRIPWFFVPEDGFCFLGERRE